MKALLPLFCILVTPALAAQRTDSATNARARFFIEKRCADCHALEALNVKAKTDVGPDLTTAYADVPARYGISLERFMEAPPGVMRLVLNEHTLERSQADSLVRLLRNVYLKRLAQLDSLRRRWPVGESAPSQDHRQ